jgi:secreted Zn-dependent insulinase-like peptidase
VAKAVLSKYPDGMYKLLKQIVAVFRSTEYDKEVMRWAKSEYKKDWEHAYHMLMQGKTPYTGV